MLKSVCNWLGAGAVLVALHGMSDSATAGRWNGPLTADTAAWNTGGNWVNENAGVVPSDAGNVGATIRAANPMDFSAVGATAEYLTVSGSLTFSGGDLTYNGDGLIGTTVFTAGNGVVTQTGGAVLQTGGGAGLLIGHNQPGQWDISGGTLQSNTPLVLGWDPGGTGQLLISGTGAVTSGNQTVVGRNASSSITQTGGSLTANTNNFLLGNGAQGTYTQTGGTFDLNSSMVIGNAGVAAHAYNVSGSSIVDIQSDLRVGLNVAGALSVTGSSATFAVGNNATFDQVDSVFNVGITSPTAFSTVTVGGGLGTLVATGADLNVTINSASDPLVSQIWTIINNTNATGAMLTFPGAVPVGVTDGFNLGSSATLLSEGSTFNVINSATLSTINLEISYVGGSGNDLTLTVLGVTPVPEPTALLTMAAGGAILLVLRRTKR